MKKLIPLLLLCALLLCACSAPAADGNRSLPAEDPDPAESELPIIRPVPQTLPEETEPVDLDLTAYEGEEAVLALEALLDDYAAYEGQRMRVRGKFQSFESHGTHRLYCVLLDEDGCSVNLEFLLTDPDAALPEAGEEICLTGIFSSYSLALNGQRVECPVLFDAHFE